MTTNSKTFSSPKTETIYLFKGNNETCILKQAAFSWPRGLSVGDEQRASRAYVPFCIWFSEYCKLYVIFSPTGRSLTRDYLQSGEMKGLHSNYVIADLISKIHVRSLTFICLNA